MAMVTAAFVSFAVSLDDNYDVNFDESKFKTFQKINRTQTELALPALEKFETTKGEVSAEGSTLVSQAIAGVKATRLLISIPGILKDVIIDTFNVLTKELGVTDEFMYGIVAIVFIIGTAGLIALVFKRTP